VDDAHLIGLAVADADLVHRGRRSHGASAYRRALERSPPRGELGAPDEEADFDLVRGSPFFGNETVSDGVFQGSS
jgi:hypothetical protein